MKSIFKHLVLFFFALSALQVQAQVTIGSAKAPIAGALLDLKTETDGSSKLGLGMPRVSLTNLEPTNNAELAQSIGNAADSYNMAEHIGLMVYNIKDAVFNTATCKTTGAPIGLYVWDGTQWQGLAVQDGGSGTDHFAENIDPITGIGTVTDYEGNVYPTKRWTSTDGGNTTISGIWMTKNLHSLRKADGTFIDCPNGMRLNPAYYYNDIGAVVVKTSVPNGTVGNYTNAEVSVSGQSYADYAKDFGLSYTHEQAVDACPRGWHLPNDDEWNLLAKSMYDAGSGVNYTNIGHIMKTSTNKKFISADNTTNNWAATSITVKENGFNALPSGYVFPDGAGAASLGTLATWWSGTTNGSYRYVYYFNPRLLSEDTALGRYLSVRCVKD